MGAFLRAEKERFEREKNRPPPVADEGRFFEECFAVRRAMIEASKEQYFLCDSSKFGKDYPFVLCNSKDMTATITDMDQNEE